MYFKSKAHVAWAIKDELFLAQFTAHRDSLRLLSSQTLQKTAASRFRGEAVWYVLNAADCCLRYGVFPAADAKTMCLAVQNTLGASLPGADDYAFDFRFETSENKKTVLAVFLPRDFAKKAQQRLAECGLTLCGFVVLPPALAGLAPDDAEILIEANCPDGSICQTVCREGLPRAWRVFTEDNPPPRGVKQLWIEDCFTVEPRTCEQADPVAAEDLLSAPSPNVPAAIWGCAKTVFQKRAFPFQEFLTEDIQRRASAPELFGAVTVWAVALTLAITDLALLYHAKTDLAKTLQVQAQEVMKQAAFSQSLSHTIMQKRRVLEAIQAEVKRPIKLVDVLRVMGIILPGNSKITSLHFNREDGITFECLSKNREDFILLLEKMKSHPMFAAPALVSNEETSGEGAEKLFRFEIQTKFQNQWNDENKDVSHVDQPGR